MIISQQSFSALENAESHMLPLCDHPAADGDAISELAQFGLIEPECSNSNWWKITPAGYDYLEAANVSVCRWYSRVIEWSR